MSGLHNNIFINANSSPIFLSYLFFPPLLALAVPALALTSGTTTTSVINSNEDVDSYSLSLNSGQNLALYVDRIGEYTSGFSPRLVVTSPSGVELVNISKNLYQQVTENGSYSVLVYDSSQNGNGEYAISYVSSPGAVDSGTLISGNTLEADIFWGDLDSYQFAADAGDTVHLYTDRFATYSSGFNPVLRVYGPDGSLLNAIGKAWVTQLTQTGTYNLVIADSNANGVGDYRLSYVRVPGSTEGGALVSGATLASQIDWGELDSFTMALTVGDSVDLYADRAGDYSSGFSPRLAIYDPQGSEVPGSGTRFWSQQATVTGDYTVIVYDSSYNGVGDYQLSYVQSPGATEGESLVSGQLTLGQVGWGALDSWQFNASANEKVLLSVTKVSGSSGFSPRLNIYDPAGAPLPGSESSNLSQTLSTGGLYNVVVYDNSVNGVGDYRLDYRLCLPAGQFRTGDVNGDCVVNMGDLLLLEKALLQQQALDTEQTARADLTADGTVDIADAKVLQDALLAN